MLKYLDLEYYHNTTTQADRVQEAFEAFPYYLLPIKDQRTLVIVMQRAQNPALLMCGTTPLNMELFVAVNVFAAITMKMTDWFLHMCL